MQKKYSSANSPESARAVVILLVLAAAAGLIAAAAIFLFSGDATDEDLFDTIDGAGGAAHDSALIAGDSVARAEREKVGLQGETVRIEGYLTLDSAPLSGVTIEAFRDYSEPLPPAVASLLRASPLIHSEAGAELKELLDEGGGSAPQPDATGTTGPDGAFVIEVTATDSVFFRLDHDFFYLTEEQAGPHPLASGTSATGLGDFDGALDAKLGCLVRGTVRDSDGFPLEQAALELGQRQTQRFGGGGGRGGFPFGGGSTPARTALSNGEGEFSLRGVPPAQDLHVQARADARAPARSKRFDAGAGQTVTVSIVLEEGATLTAFARGPDGEPLAGAEIYLEKEVGDEDAAGLGGFGGILRMIGTMAADTGKTDGNGAVRFDALGPGEYSLRGAYRGMAEAVTDDPLLVAEEDRSLTAELRFSFGQAISGRVLDDASGPVAGATVRAREATGGRGGFDFRRMQRSMNVTEASAKEASSAADGSFTISGLEPGSAYDLTADAAGFITTRETGVDVDGEDPTIVMGRPGQVEGRVVALADGGPVKSFVVRIAPVADEESGDRFGRRDDGRGRGGPPSQNQRGRGGNRGGDRGDRSDRGGRGSFGGGRGGSGGGADSATRRVFETISRTFQGSFARPPRVTDREEEFHHNDGRFSLSDILPGTYRLCVSASRFAPGVSETISVEKGFTARDIVVALGPGAVIAGRVIDPDGPVKEARLVLRSEEDGEDAPDPLALDSIEPAESDAAGEFRLESLPAGMYTIRATHPEHPEAVTDTLILPTGGLIDGVVIVLPAGGTIRGVAYDARGLPLASTRVMCTRDRDFRRMKRERTDSEGQFEFRGLAEGTWSIQLMAGGRGFFGRSGSDTGAVEVPIAEGEVRDITLMEEPLTGSTVIGTVTDRGAPVEGGFLMVNGPSRRGPTRTAAINRDGTYTIEGIEPGHNRFSIRFGGADGMERATLGFEIPDVPEVALDIGLPCGAIGGRVIDAGTGRPIEGVSLRLRSPGDAGGNRGGMMGRWGGGGSSDRSDEEGLFSFTRLPAGEYSIEARPSSNVAGPLGTGYRDTTIEGIVLAKDQKLDGLTVSLATGGGLRVVVNNSSGEPVRSALVTATRNAPEVAAPEGADGGRGDRGGRGGGGGSSRGRTNGDGEALITGLEPGTWSISVRASDMAQKTVESIQVREGMLQDVSVALETGFEVSVRLVDDQGAPVENARLSLADSQGRSIGVAPTRRRGNDAPDPNVYTLGTLLPDTYTLRVRWSGKNGTGTFSAGGPGTVNVVVASNG